MVFNATFNNISVISWWSVLFVEETGGPGENHRPVASHWQPLSHNVIHLSLISRYEADLAVFVISSKIFEIKKQIKKKQPPLPHFMTFTLNLTQCLSPLMLWVRISIRERCITLCDKVCQWLVPGRRFSSGTLVSCTKKTDRHDRTEILLKVA
jgi:hypothetical protein